MVMVSVLGLPADNAKNHQPTSSQSNKNRLYLAFYTKTYQWEPRVRYQTALLVTPKKPNPSLVQTWRYHVRDNFVEGLLRYEFEGIQTVNVDRRLVALVHVCKLDPEISGVGLSMLLKELEVDEEEGDIGAVYWVWKAIRHLVERGVISPLHLRPQKIWENGYQFAQAVEGREEGRVPTCDIYGTRQQSEVARP
ncbi:hypothetical protein JAAARDRAFT_37095 [Jaapia argillacea MUCL 33604]|uniref:Uncharacterized protein n=1 Tax=Jaapia argillacea MUCL 33604 TaxID=933084 RepID=A0A067PZA8_9AGAM|nr:hypothetical protein JAAARDRAFT_37095 [Jaapia argillacea MUCL 33604]